MKKTAFLPILFLLVLAYASCEKENASDVNQDKIYTDYEMFYNKNTDKTWAVARFRFGGVTGTPLELDSTAFVTFNGDTMPFNGLFLGHFKEYAGRLTSGTFSYTNMNGQTYVNSTPSYDTIAFQASFDTIQKSVANTFTWDGPALSSNQNVGLFIGSWTWGQDALFGQNAVGGTNIVMGITQMANLPVGPAVCHLERSTDIAVAQGTSEGGRIRAKYKALTDTVQVVP